MARNYATVIKILREYNCLVNNPIRFWIALLAYIFVMRESLLFFGNFNLLVCLFVGHLVIGCKWFNRDRPFKSRLVRSGGEVFILLTINWMVWITLFFALLALPAKYVILIGHNPAEDQTATGVVITLVIMGVPTALMSLMFLVRFRREMRKELIPT